MALVPLSDFLLGPHKHWQCQSRRSARRPQHDQRPIQRQSDHLLRQLLCVRAAYKRALEEVTPQHLLAVDYDLVGNLHDMHGSRAQLCRVDDSSE